MSIAFLKDPEGETLEDLPERPVSPHRNLVTPEGMAQIEREVARLEGELSRAQHSEDDEDRHHIARIARDLRYWMARRSTAELVPPINDMSKVHFGSTVTIEREDGRRQLWRIVGEDEADPSQKTISHVSPLARALVNKKVGDVVEVNSMDVEIVAIA
jgi:transcription elongation GreA/GreB family factor